MVANRLRQWYVSFAGGPTSWFGGVFVIASTEGRAIELGRAFFPEGDPLCLRVPVDEEVAPDVLGKPFRTIKDLKDATGPVFLVHHDCAVKAGLAR